MDTPATSRINATIPQETTYNADDRRSTKAEVIELFLNRFPNFSEYARLHNLNVSVNSSGSMFNLTTACSLLLGDKLTDILADDGGQVDAMKRNSLHGSLTNLSEGLEYAKFPQHSNYARNLTGLLDSQSIEGLQLEMTKQTGLYGSLTNLNEDLEYSKFPQHSNYARNVTGLLNSQSIDASIHSMQQRTSDDRSLPDIVGELRRRDLLRQPFQMTSKSDDSSSAEELRNTSQHPVPPNRRVTAGAVDALEKELEAMGMGWACSLLKKSKETSALSTSSSSRSEHDVSHGRRRAPRPMSWKTNSVENREITVDPDIIEIEDEPKPSTSKDPMLNDSETRQVSLKQFLASELMKHSSTSSSSWSSSIDSSLASVYLKSFLARSASGDPSGSITGRRSNQPERQRTSTPVQDSVSASNGTNRKKSPENELDPTRSQSDQTEKLFSGESHISSVRNCSSDTDITLGSSPNEVQRHRRFEARSVSANMKLSL